MAIVYVHWWILAFYSISVFVFAYFNVLLATLSLSLFLFLFIFIFTGLNPAIIPIAAIALMMTVSFLCYNTLNFFSQHLIFGFILLNHRLRVVQQLQSLILRILKLQLKRINIQFKLLFYLNNKCKFTPICLRIYV